MQGPRNRNRTNIAPKTNTDICNCELLVQLKRGTNKYLQKIPGKPSLRKIQKTVLSTAHILRKALSI